MGAEDDRSLLGNAEPSQASDAPGGAEPAPSGPPAGQYPPAFPYPPAAPYAPAGPYPPVGPYYPAGPYAPAGAPVYGWTPPPPFMPQAPASPWATPRFVDSGRLALAAQCLIGLAGLLALATAFNYLLGMDLQGRLNTARALQSDADAMNRLTATLAWLAIGLQVVCGVVFMRWQWRSMVNSTILGANPSSVGSPRSAVVSWIVPILNLFRPYQFVADLHDRLLAPLQSSSGRWLLRLWWAFWIAGDIVGWFVMFVIAPSIRPESTANRLEVMAGEAFLHGILFADAILAIAVIRQVQRLSEARLVARMGDPGRAIDLVGRAQRPRVTRLPFALAAVAVVAICIPTGLAYAGASGSPAWVQFQSADGSFTASLPGQPLEKKIPADSSSGMTLSGDSFRAGESVDLVFVITYYDYPAGTIESIRPAAAFKNMDAAMSGTYTIESTAEIAIDGRPAHEVRFRGPDFVAVARYVIVGRRVYVIEADASAGLSTSPDITRFLDSFSAR